jgi:hypothetical protein
LHLSHITNDMRSLLFVSCFFTITSFAQRHEYTRAFEKNIPPGLGEPFRLPAEPAHLSEIANYALVTRIQIIGTEEAYRKAFPRYIYTKDSLEKYRDKEGDWYYKLLLRYQADSLPKIDFQRKELVIFSGCGHCLAYCSYENGYHPCHRNACMYLYRSVLRDKKHDPFSARGERKNFLEALYNIPPGGMHERTDMSGNPEREVLKLLGKDKRSSYLLRVNDSLFNRIYAWDIQYYPSGVPRVNLAEQELWLRLVCHQCLLHCDPNDPAWDNMSCHRGRCVYDQKWFVKEIHGSGN